MIKKLYFDTETGGLDAKKNPLIQIAGVIVVDDVEQGSFNWTIAPFEGQVCEATALEVNGRTEIEVRGFNAHTTVMRNLQSVLAKYVDKFDKSDKLHLVAYNSPFDVEFLRQFFTNCNDKYFGSWFWVPDQCIMRYAGAVLAEHRHKLTNFKLGTVAEFLGIDISQMKLHDALADIRVTMEVERKLKEMQFGVTLKAGVTLPPDVIDLFETAGIERDNDLIKETA
jgi:DNA polymerase III subunit epsilon